MVCQYLRQDFATWELTSDHDSCWRSDGIGTPFFDLAFAMMEELRPRVRKGWPGVDSDVRFLRGPELREVVSLKVAPETGVVTVEYPRPEIIRAVIGS